MKAEFYLTLLDGLLATAVYYPRKSAESPGVPGYWTVPLGKATGTPAGTSGTSITKISSRPGNPATIPERGMNSSATPVCGYRLSLHC